jgi:general stress protein 26
MPAEVIHKPNLFPLFLSFLVLGSSALAQNAGTPRVHTDSLIAAAREIIGQLKYCVFVTLDSTGRPNLRTMNPFPPGKDMTVWMATNSRSRKAHEIKMNPSVNLFYGNLTSATGYVSIRGKAFLVDDMNEKLKRNRGYWAQAFPDWKYLLLIKVVPERMEVINYRRGVVSDSLTWKVPMVEFNSP